MFVLDSPITTSINNAAAIFSIDSFIFYNSFVNVDDTSNSLEVTSTYNDASGVPQTNDSLTVSVPNGHYSVAELLAYLNQDNVCNKVSGGYYYGLGNSGGVVDYPAFSVNPFQNGKINFHPPSGGVGGALGKWKTGSTVSPHQYTGFYLKVTPKTIGLMKKMGLFNIQSGTTPVGLTRIPNSNDLGLGFSVRHNPTTDTGFYYGNSLTDVETTEVQVADSPTEEQQPVDFGGPICLAVAIHQTASGGGGRNSFSQFSQSGTIGYAPVNSAYGELNVYIPDQPLKSYVEDPQISRLKVEIRDCLTGATVDFQGMDWVLNLRVEFCEITTELTQESNMGNPKNQTQRMNRTPGQLLPRMEPDDYHGKKKRLLSASQDQA